MIIEFDEDGFVKYLYEVLTKIRRENSEDNNSVFNINPSLWKINDVIIRQNITCPYFDHKEDETSGANDIMPINNNDQISRNTVDIIVAKITKIRKYLSESQIKQGVVGWINYRVDAQKKNLGKTQEKINDNRDIKERLSEESKLSISGFKGTNDSQQNNNQNILKYISQRVFVCECDLSLNKTFYTREQKDWESIASTLSFEKELIIIDPYFFLSEGEFGKRELLFLDAICNSEDEKFFVIVHRNCVCAEWLEEFARIFKDGDSDMSIKSHKSCHLTFVGVKDNKLLHDRCVISNHRLIFSGHSFPLYFKEDGKFSANGSLGLSVGSIADANTEHVMAKTIEYLQHEVLSKKNAFIYGDIKSQLLDLSKINKWIPITPIKDILQDYPLKQVVKIEKDADGNIHWGNFLINNNKDIYGKKARLVNIKKNKEKNKYKWLAYAYILSGNNDNN